MPRWFLYITKHGDSASSLGNLCWYSVTIRVKMFPCAQRERSCFWFKTIANGSVTGHHWKQFESVFFSQSFQVLMSIYRYDMSPWVLFFRWNKPLKWEKAQRRWERMMIPWRSGNVWLTIANTKETTFSQYKGDQMQPLKKTQKTSIEVEWINRWCKYFSLS